jgi:hypothetical protein
MTGKKVTVAARWQLILDLLDPDNRCGAWSPATVQGRPVVCTRACMAVHKCAQRRRPHIGIMWVINRSPRPSGSHNA